MQHILLALLITLRISPRLAEMHERHLIQIFFAVFAGHVVALRVRLPRELPDRVVFHLLLLHAMVEHTRLGEALLLGSAALSTSSLSILLLVHLSEYMYRFANNSNKLYNYYLNNTN